MNLLKYFPIAEKHIKPTSCPQKGSFRFVQKASECTGDFISGCRMNDELEIQQNCPIRRRSGNEGYFGNSLSDLLLMLTKNILYHLNISIYDNNLVLFLNNCVITNCTSLVKAMFIKIKVLDGRITNKHKNRILRKHCRPYVNAYCMFVLNTNLFIDSYALDIHYYPYLQ